MVAEKKELQFKMNKILEHFIWDFKAFKVWDDVKSQSQRITWIEDSSKSKFQSKNQCLKRIIKHEHIKLKCKHK